jgi:putative tricarboxylic transport membrane protein
VVTIFFGAFQSSQHFGDIYAMLGLGFLGWLMKQLGWPRAPFLVGFVLTKPTEQYLWLSISRYGLEWLLRPGVIVLGLLLLASIVWIVLGKRGAKIVPGDESSENAVLLGKIPSVLFTFLVLVVVTAALYDSRSFPYLGAIFPMAATIPAIIMAALQIVFELRATGETVAAETRKKTKLALGYFFSLLLYLLLILLLGFGIATAVFTFVFLYGWARVRALYALIYTASVVGLAHLMSSLLGLYWPAGLLLAL